MLQVLAALGTVYFEHVLPDIIRNCSHQRASVRDGYLTLFKVNTSLYDSLLISEVFAYRLSVIVAFLWELLQYLPRSLGIQFQNYLQQALPAILDGTCAIIWEFLLCFVY